MYGATPPHTHTFYMVFFQSSCPLSHPPPQVPLKSRHKAGKEKGAGGSWASQKQLAEEDSLKWVGRCVPKAPQSWQPWLPAAVGCAQNKHKWMDEFRLESHLASQASGTTLGDSPAS